MNGLGRGDKQDKKEKNSIFTRETVGMTLLLFSALALLICLTRSLMFGDVGIAITAFLLGCFGYLAYPMLALLICISVQLVIGKRFLPRRWTGWALSLICIVFFIVHLATSARFLGEGYGSYLANCFTSAKGGITTCTAGGILYGLITYPLQAILSVAGAYVVLSFALAILLFFLLRATPLWERVTGKKRDKAPTVKVGDTQGRVRSYPGSFEELETPERTVSPLWEERGAAVAEPVRTETDEPTAYSAYERKLETVRNNREILFSGTPTSNYRDNLIFDKDSRFNTQPRGSNLESIEPRTVSTVGQSYQESYSREAEVTRPSMPRRVETQEKGANFESDLNYQTPSYRAAPAPTEQTTDYYRKDVAPAPVPVQEEPSYEEYEEEFSSAPHIDDVAEEASTPAPQAEERTSSVPDFRSLFSSSNERLRTFDTPVSETPARERTTNEELFPDTAISESRAIDGVRESAAMRESAADIFDSDEEVAPPEDDAPAEPVRMTRDLSAPRVRESVTPIPETPAPAPQKRVFKPYRQPSMSSFRSYDDSVNISQEEIDRNSAIIVETLAGFRVDAEVVRVTCGSTVTRYDIDIPGNISVATVIKRDEEIAMRLHARDGVNMYANHERGTISIEVPNSKRVTVGMKSIMQCDDYVNAKPNALSFVIGKDVEGRPVCGNIVKMKHVLVAGATGSGKSVCLNAMLISLISKYSPEDLRLILIDPKKVEFAIYDGLPHLMINEIIADAQKAVTALNWAIKEMERRYKLFEAKTKSGKLVYNIDDYNACRTEDEDKLAKIVVVVDELADLMSVAKKDIEERIQRLTQKARAAGIHLVIATQRPSVDVITGVIKGNLPTRIAFRVIQEVDSRTILDESGAQKLLGLGDLLYRTEGMFNCARVQGAFLSAEEVQAIVEDIKANNETYFDEAVADYINNTSATSGGGGGEERDDSAVDPQYIRALAMVVKLGTASISLIQRKCSVGYNHAGKIIEWMDAMGYISPFDGKAKARTVLLTKEEYESKYGSLD